MDTPDAGDKHAHASFGLGLPVGNLPVAGQSVLVTQSGKMPRDYNAIGDSDIADLDGTEEILELFCHLEPSYSLKFAKVYHRA
jgi:hypothetical protein